MGNLNSFRRKLNDKNVWIAQETERRKIELAKQMVKDRIQNDADFAKEVLDAVGNLPDDFKEAAEKTLKDHAKKINEERYQKVIEHGAQELADTIDNNFLEKIITNHGN